MGKVPKLDVTVKIPPSMFDALDALAKASNGEFTRSDIIRQAITEYLLRFHQANPQTKPEDQASKAVSNVPTTI